MIEEKKEHPGVVGNPEISSPLSDSPATNVSGKTGSAPRDTSASEEKKPALSQRLAEAFREGVVSVKPDHEKRPEVKIPPPAKNNLQEPGDGGVLDRVIREGGSTAAVAGDMAASALDAFSRLIKKAPALTQKYAEAFREGAATVKYREGRERRGYAPQATKKKETPADDRAIRDRVFHVGESAAGFVREAVALVSPGEALGVRQKIRGCKKKISSLYIDIGKEAVNSWSDELVETEKLASLLDELQKNEDEILNLQAHLAEVAATKKAGPVRSPQAVVKEAVFTSAMEKEDSRVEVGVSDVKQDEPVGKPAETADLPEPEIRLDAAPEITNVSVSAMPDSEHQESPGDKVAAEAALQEGLRGGADQVMPEEPEVRQGKKRGGSSGRGGNSAAG